MTEQWKRCSRNGRYEVSNHGNVRNRDTNHVLRPRDNGYGLDRVQLCANGDIDDVYIHQLVASEFMKTRKKDTKIRHKDGNTHNNSLNNLEYICEKEKKHGYNLENGTGLS